MCSAAQLDRDGESGNRKTGGTAAKGARGRPTVDPAEHGGQVGDSQKMCSNIYHHSIQTIV